MSCHIYLTSVCFSPGWSLVLLVCLVSAFFTLLYGNSYGKTKAEAWLLTFFTSFLLDVVILQPVKVLVVAVVLAVIVKSVDTGDDDAVTAKLGQDEEFLHISAAEDANIERPTPPVTDPQKLAAARQLRAKQRQMYSVMVEVIFYLLFVWVTVSIANGHRSESAFYQNTDIKETFLAPVTEDDGFLDGAETYVAVVARLEIGNLDDFWGWLEDGLLPGLTEEWYNGDTVDNSAYTAGLVHYLVGVTRLRQIRVRSEYSWDNEDTRPMNNRAVNQTTSPWVYQTSAALNGYPFWGTFALYAGGGYVAELGTNSRESATIIQNLKDNAWLDDNTRAVLVEFTMYNAYVNLFSVTLALEMPVSGGVFPRADIQTVRLYNYTSQYTLYILACEILYIFMLVFYLYREVKELRQKKCQYFSEFWNWVEVLVALLSLCAVGLFACRMVITDRVTAYRRSNPGRFVNYSEAAFWDAVYGYVIAVIVTLVIAKFVKLLRFNRRMSLIGDTIKHAAPKVLGFVVIYIVVIMAFAQALFLVLGNTSESFGTFLSCLETLWNIQLGEFEFSDFWDGHWLLGPTLWFCFVVTSNCILVFTFVAIMMDSFERVNANIGKQSNDHEIVDFMSSDDLTEEGKQAKMTKSRERRNLEKKRKWRLPWREGRRGAEKYPSSEVFNADEHRMSSGLIYDQASLRISGAPASCSQVSSDGGGEKLGVYLYPGKCMTEGGGQPVQVSQPDGGGSREVQAPNPARSSPAWQTCPLQGDHLSKVTTFLWSPVWLAWTDSEEDPVTTARRTEVTALGMDLEQLCGSQCGPKSWSERKEEPNFDGQGCVKEDGEV
ncbi:hypothetical protein Bbelb_161190 [Branchiostoma belcheri]|nr:hypothetical protein Bbelb_161190 [Branchiostoma belcheri]